MQVEKTALSGVLIITPKVFGDHRGFFMESYNLKTYRAAGVDAEFVQDNHSKSAKNVLRGLHYQLRYPQGKLIRVLKGTVLDVIADVRRGSPTFGKWVGVEISEENKKQVWIPPGYAHGFSVLSDSAEFTYKVTDYYHPEDEGGVRFDDPELKIDWGIKDPMLSQKDLDLPLLADAELPPF